eukprot:gene23998-9569_t
MRLRCSSSFASSKSARASAARVSSFCPVAPRCARYGSLLIVRGVADTRAERERAIENLNKQYCDDFECTSSPAVEQSVRSFARDLELLRYTAGGFDRDCKYDDGFRQVTGAQNVAKQRWIKENFKKPTVTIQRLQMLDKSTAQVDWTLVGDMNGSAADIRFVTIITMNLLTGRITSLSEKWDLSKCNAASALKLTGSRVTYSAKKASEDVGDGIKKIGESIDESLSSFEENGDSSQNPNDPMKFFQPENPNGDYINFALVVAVMYLVFKGFEQTATL